MFPPSPPNFVAERNPVNAAIGFLDSLNESTAVLTVQVGIISGSLQTDTVSNLSTMDITAIGEIHY